MKRNLFILMLAAIFLAGCSTPASPDGPAGASPTVVKASDTAIRPAIPSASAESVIRAENVDQVKQLTTLKGHSNRVTDVAFSPDGAYLASSGWDRKIRLWDTRSWQEVNTFDIRKSDLNVIAFSPDGQRLASAEAIWEVESGQTVLQLAYTGEVGHVAFSPDGSMLALGGFPAQITLLDSVSGQLIRTFETEAGVLGYFSVVFSPDGKTLAAGGAQYGTVTLWDVESGKITATFKHGDQSDVHDIAFSPDGRLLAGGGTGSAVRIWDVKSGEEVQKLWLTNGIYGLTFSPDGKILALASCNRVAQLWNIESGSTLRNLRHADELMAVAFSPDGSLFATGGYDNTVVVWGIPR